MTNKHIINKHIIKSTDGTSWRLTKAEQKRLDKEAIKNGYAPIHVTDMDSYWDAIYQSGDPIDQKRADKLETICAKILKGIESMKSGEAPGVK